MPYMTRAEHLEWCKARAREYLDQGDARNAIASMHSDMKKHPETATAIPPELAMLGLMTARDNDVQGARRYIEGFN